MSLRQQRPNVQIPLHARTHKLTVDGETARPIPKEEMDAPEAFMAQTHPTLNLLPPEASHAYWNWVDTDGNGRVYQCGDCGYLSASKHCGPGTRQTKRCSNCSNVSWRLVYSDGAPTDRDEETVDPLALDADDVPNHASLLGRIQNELRHHVERSEMLDRVADAVAAGRRDGSVKY